MSAVDTMPKVDASDLDMLDDAIRHASCTRCYPQPLTFGERFIAVCGREAISRGTNTPRPPPNACEGCLRRQCLRCGL